MDNRQDPPSGTGPSAPPMPPQVPVHKQTPSAPPQHPPHAPHGASGKKFPTRIAVIAAIAVLAVLLLIFLLPGGEESSSMADSIPTQRQMLTDAKTILDDECKVLSLEIDDDNFSERFKTYQADCTVTISRDGENTDVSVTLTYEYENDQWILVTK